MIRHKAGEAVPVAFRAAGCFCLSGDEVLLIQRQQGKPFALHWGIPTGKIEPGETAAQCMARELAEEIGLAVQLDALMPVADYVVDDRGTVFDYTAFALRLPNKPELTLRREEVRRAEWVKVTRVRKRRVVPFFGNTLRDLREWIERGEVAPRPGFEPEVNAAGTKT